MKPNSPSSPQHRHPIHLHLPGATALNYSYKTEPTAPPQKRPSNYTENIIINLVEHFEGSRIDKTNFDVKGKPYTMGESPTKIIGVRTVKPLIKPDCITYTRLEAIVRSLLQEKTVEDGMGIGKTLTAIIATLAAIVAGKKVPWVVATGEEMSPVLPCRCFSSPHGPTTAASHHRRPPCCRHTPHAFIP